MGWIIEHAEVVSVAPDSVFALYADPTTWSRWGHSARWAEADAPLAPGVVVRVKSLYGAVYRCNVRRFDPGCALELEVRPVGLRIINSYEVDQVAEGTRIRHAFEVSGPLSTPARALAGVYRRLLVKEVHAVAALAGRDG